MNPNYDNGPDPFEYLHGGSLPSSGRASARLAAASEDLANSFDRYSKSLSARRILGPDWVLRSIKGDLWKRYEISRDSFADRFHRPIVGAIMSVNRGDFGLGYVRTIDVRDNHFHVRVTEEDLGLQSFWGKLRVTERFQNGAGLVYKVDPETWRVQPGVMFTADAFVEALKNATKSVADTTHRLAQTQILNTPPSDSVLAASAVRKAAVDLTGRFPNGVILLDRPAAERYAPVGLSRLEVHDLQRQSLSLLVGIVCQPDTTNDPLVEHLVKVKTECDRYGFLHTKVTSKEVGRTMSVLSN